MPREYAKGKTCSYCDQVIEYNGGTGHISGKDYSEWYHVGCQIVDKKWEEDYKLLDEASTDLITTLTKLIDAVSPVFSDKPKREFKIVRNDDES